MAKNQIYRISITNWEKYNGAKKKGHQCILLSTGFLTDAKIRTLPPGGKLLYLGLLLRCGEVVTSEIEATKDLLVSLAGGSGQHVERLLDQMQELQLLTFEKIELFLNRKEKKIKEKKIKEGPQNPKQPATPVAIAPAIGKNLTAFYCDCYKARYRENPVIRPQDGKALKTLGESVGEERAKSLIRAYLEMNNSWFITKAHDVATLITNLNQVQNYASTGRIVTAQDAKSAEASESLQNQIARLAGGER